MVQLLHIQDLIIYHRDLTTALFIKYGRINLIVIYIIKNINMNMKYSRKKSEFCIFLMELLLKLQEMDKSPIFKVIIKIVNKKSEINGIKLLLLRIYMKQEFMILISIKDGLKLKMINQIFSKLMVKINYYLSLRKKLNKHCSFLQNK